MKSEFNKFSSYDKKRIQRHLKSEGYYKSSIDGTWGAKTKSALKAGLKYSSSMSNRTWVKKELTKLRSSSYEDSNCFKSDLKQCNNTQLCKKATYLKTSDAGNIRKN